MAESDAGAGNGGVSRWVWAGVMSLMFVCICMLSFVCVQYVLYCLDFKKIKQKQCSQIMVPELTGHAEFVLALTHMIELSTKHQEQWCKVLK